ncbi:zinc finger protein 367-like [Saccostrea echinata]|uniref:zinc finger protein 367-like n=1 Tax=Saccostrea echinata TaxID=191078 RepID=UPI002A8163CF|nr:zinc finger protein 367-like [Saccostrea echinata]
MISSNRADIRTMPYSPSPTSFGRGSPEGDSADGDSEYEDPNMRRGRPRADIVNSLIFKGSMSNCSIRCEVCSRVFPREKSLQAHMRTHTGERPYGCDYPGCEKAFCQSGQLKTHQRLHTGEKPFMCSETGCTSRFTHANRHCSDHPYATLVRVGIEVSIKDLIALREQETNTEVREWLEIQIISRQDRSGHRNKNRKPLKRPSDGSPAEESQPEQKIKVEDTEPKYTAPITNENIQPLNNNNNTIYHTPIKEEIKFDPMTVDHSAYNPPIIDYKMPLYYNDYTQYHNSYSMQPVRSEYEMQYPVSHDYHMDHKDNIPQVELYNNPEPYNHEYTVTELQPVSNVKMDPNNEDIGEMTLSQQTDKWISALALVELSHADL